MKTNQRLRLIYGIILILTVIGIPKEVLAQKNKPSYFLLSGPGYSYHRIDELVEGSKLKSGIGYVLGGGIQYGDVRLSFSYLNTWHNYEMETEKVGMKFSDMMVNVSADFSGAGYPKPYIVGLFSFTNLTDKYDDGYKTGTTFGVGLGLRFKMYSKLYFNTSAVYGINKYKKLEVADASWADQTDVSGNYVLISGCFEYCIK